MSRRSRKHRGRQKERWRDIVVVAAASEALGHEQAALLSEQTRPDSPFLERSLHPPLLRDQTDDAAEGDGDG